MYRLIKFWGLNNSILIKIKEICDEKSIFSKQFARKNIATSSNEAIKWLSKLPRDWGNFDDVNKISKLPLIINELLHADSCTPVCPSVRPFVRPSDADQTKWFVLPARAEGDRIRPYSYSTPGVDRNVRKPLTDSWHRFKTYVAMKTSSMNNFVHMKDTKDNRASKGDKHVERSGEKQHEIVDSSKV